MPSWLQGLAILVLTLLAPGCDRSPAPPSTSAPAPPTQSSADHTPQALSQGEATSSVAKDPPSPTNAEAVERVVARHVLVAHEAAKNKPMNVHRSRASARRRAEQLLARLEAGEDFAELAKKESDCSSAPRGGFLGGFGRGVMAEAFEQASFGLPVGGLSPVVETPFGFHVILREELQEVHLAQILLAFEGSPASHPNKPATLRTREEAKEQAELAYERLQGGEDFNALAQEVSDGAAGVRGGDLGWFTRGQFLPAWEERAFALEPGAISEPFETTVGFHLLWRVE